MNKNVESQFAQLPTIDVKRSMFDRSCGHKTTFNIGDLIPLYWDFMLPGDTVQATTSSVIRLQTPLTPIFDNIYLDVHWFNVPLRLVYNKTKEFFGENTSGPWIPEAAHNLPICSFPEGGFDVGTIADYLGVPTGVSSDQKSDWPCALPFRAYALIANEWYRSEALSDPLNIPMDEADQAGSNGSSYINDVANGGKPFKAAKFFDLFTSCLPSPQRGEAVTLGLAGLAPVNALTSQHLGSVSTVRWNTQIDGAGQEFQLVRNAVGSSAGNQNAEFRFTPLDTNVTMYPMNLWADLSEASAVSVNDLRLAFQLQKFYEASARSGNRYREYILGMYGVHSLDARMQIPEYLGGHRFPLQIHQVANTSQGENDFLGDLGAVSNTANIHDDITFSSTEFSILMCVAVARYDHSYPQGMARQWSYRNKFDFALPVFAHLGEIGVRKRELCFKTHTSADIGSWDNGDIFGYNENYYEYRYSPNRCSGEMRPGINNSLASWHLSDYYTSVPSLSDEWIREDKSNVDRVLSVTSSVSNQIFGDFWFKMTWTRPLPMYSVPGLVDHF